MSPAEIEEMNLLRSDNRRMAAALKDAKEYQTDLALAFATATQILLTATDMSKTTQEDRQALKAVCRMVAKRDARFRAALVSASPDGEAPLVYDLIMIMAGDPNAMRRAEKWAKS